MIWILKTISNRVDNYKFWNNRIIEMRLKYNRGYITIIGLYAPDT